MTTEMRPVHGGLVDGIWVDGVALDDCNAFCQGDTHCSLFYADHDAPLDVLRRISEREMPDMEILRVEPAPEAPPLTESRAVYMEKTGPPGGVERSAGFLLFWRLRK